MATYNAAMRLLERYRKTHGHKYYLFIAPTSEKRFNALDSWQYGRRKEPIPEVVLRASGDLDIYFIKHGHGSVLNHEGPLVIGRFGHGGPPPL